MPSPPYSLSSVSKSPLVPLLLSSSNNPFSSFRSRLQDLPNTEYLFSFFCFPLINSRFKKTQNSPQNKIPDTRKPGSLQYYYYDHLSFGFARQLLLLSSLPLDVTPLPLSFCNGHAGYERAIRREGKGREGLPNCAAG